MIFSIKPSVKLIFVLLFIIGALFLPQLVVKAAVMSIEGIAVGGFGLPDKPIAEYTNSELLNTLEISVDHTETIVDGAPIQTRPLLSDWSPKWEKYLK